MVLEIYRVSVGLLVEGMHYGWSSSAVPKLLEPPYNISQQKAACITQMFTYGSLTYTILSFSDYPRQNQRIGVISSVSIMTFSWILIGLSQTEDPLIVARFFAGAGRGLVYQVSMNYICEIAQPEIRGCLGSLAVVMNNLGVLLIYSFGPYMSIFYSSLIAAGIALTELIAIKWVPESPYNLLLRDKTSKAREVFRSLRNLWNVEEELDRVSDSVKKQDEENSSFWSFISVPSNRKALFVIIVLNAFQGLVGINVPIHQILKLSGGNLESYRVAVVSSFVSVVSCILTALFIDYVGRRVILIISFSGCAMTLFLLAYHSFLYSSTTTIPSLHILPLVCLLIYTMVYRMGVGLVPLLLSSELFPMNVKITAGSLTMVLSPGMNFISVWMLEQLKRHWGLHVMYLVCGLNCILGVWYTWWYVPETKGKSLEEIQDRLKNEFS